MGGKRGEGKREGVGRGKGQWKRRGEVRVGEGPASQIFCGRTGEGSRVLQSPGVSKVKVKFSHTRYRALGPELIPVYRQSARR